MFDPVIKGDLKRTATNCIGNISDDIEANYILEEDISLGFGQSGQFLFLSTVPDFNDKKIELYQRILLDRIGNHQQIMPGVMYGYAGVGLALLPTLRRNRNEILNFIALKTIKSIRSNLRNNHYDYFSGYLGEIYFLSQTFNIESEEIVKDIIANLYKTSILVNNKRSWTHSPNLSTIVKNIDQAYQEPSANLGMAHGIPGIISVLLKLKSHLSMLDLSGIIQESVNFLINEERQVLNDHNEFYYLRYSGTTGDILKGGLSWCYSDLGISMAFLNLYKQTGSKIHLNKCIQLARCCSKKRIKDTIVTNGGLCHGAAGIAHIFNVLYQNLRLDCLRDASEYWFSVLLNEFYNQNNRLQSESENKYSYIDGLSGIGLALYSGIHGQSDKWDKPLLINL